MNEGLSPLGKMDRGQRDNPAAIFSLPIGLLAAFLQKKEEERIIWIVSERISLG
jgi:hypothetical protein